MYKRQSDFATFCSVKFSRSASGMKALESVREGMLKNIYAMARPAVTGDFPCLWMAIVPKEERKPCKRRKKRALLFRTVLNTRQRRPGTALGRRKEATIC